MAPQGPASSLQQIKVPMSWGHPPDGEQGSTTVHVPGLQGMQRGGCSQQGSRATGTRNLPGDHSAGLALPRCFSSLEAGPG